MPSSGVGIPAGAGDASRSGWAWWRAELRLADAPADECQGQDVAVVGVIDGQPAATGRIGVHFPFLIEAGPAWLPRRVALIWYAAKPR